MAKSSSKLNKRVIAIMSAAIIAVVGVMATVFALNNNRNSEEYVEQSEIYDRQVAVAEKVNSAISDSEKSAEEAISQEVGDDKSKIEDLNSKKEELSSYRIEIPESKTTGLNGIKKDNEKLAEALNKVEDNLANLSSEEVGEFKIAKESKLGVLIENITSLVEEIKAQAQKYAEQKAAEEAKQKILSGDLSAFVGTYNDSGYKVIIKNNEFHVSGSRVYKAKDMKISQTNNGSYLFETEKKALTTVTGYTTYMSNSFTISADGKTIEFSDSENLCAYKLTKTN